ncbi:MAG: GNAT family N-acetyltransferase [Hyphomicrobiales bacterium]|nr:GNAT family N-acetyltransferase [Hyphomicrobiales bacterium]
MIDVVTWENAGAFGHALASHHKLRYRVFVEGQGWDVPNYHGMEYDQFDTPAAAYLLWRDHDGEVRGVTRLIPTERPYMIKELWPHFVEGHDLPASAKVWEATRFGIDDRLDHATRRRISAELVLACQEFGLAHGVDQFLVMMPVLIIRKVIGGAGCPYEWLGSPHQVGRHRVAAASVDVSSAILSEARMRLGVTYPVLSNGERNKEAA